MAGPARSLGQHRSRTDLGPLPLGYGSRTTILSGAKRLLAQPARGKKDKRESEQQARVRSKASVKPAREEVVLFLEQMIP
jgi:hypothetical protein